MALLRQCLNEVRRRREPDNVHGALASVVFAPLSPGDGYESELPRNLPDAGGAHRDDDRILGLTRPREQRWAP